MLLIGGLILTPWLSNTIGRLPTDVIVALQNKEFYLCTNGLIITEWTHVQALRWEQIKSIRRCATHNIRRPYYILYCDNRKPVTLRWSQVGSGISDLGETIEHEVRQHLLPEAITAYEAGQMLNFGSINVTAQGLTLEDEQQSLSWDRFVPIEYYNGPFFTIKEGATAATWQRIEVTSMLNFCVFLPLTTHIKNSLRAYADESDDTATEEEATQRDAANHHFQERFSTQEEELERARRVHGEILESLRSRYRITPIPEEVVEALLTIDLSTDASFDSIHQRYRQLAKRFHPDTGGDPESFRHVDAAYKCVITWIAAQDQENT